MLRVIIESPLAPSGGRSLTQHYAYAKQCLADSLKRGEAPFASHILYPLVLDDHDPAQRLQGMQAGFLWGDVADLVAVYEDYGISNGMRQGIEVHEQRGLKIERRKILKSLPAAIVDLLKDACAAPFLCRHCRDSKSVSGIPCTVCGDPAHACPGCA